MMWNPKGNEYGVRPHYEVGDRVKVWPIFKNPIGTVEAIEDAECFPIKYRIRYDYCEGGTYIEVFDANDLTLYERRTNYMCNCHTVIAEQHMTWCNRYNKSTWR